MSVNPPRSGLPPLNALRAFESAARLGGFKLAAAELNVTPGAVAQHIKFLEAWCGAPLFERKAQGVHLTPLGQQVLPDFEAAFDAVSLASQRLRLMAAPLNVSIATLPSVAQLLVAEWLPQLREVAEGVQISVTAMEDAPNLAREPFDLNLFYEDRAIDWLLPVCTAEIADRISGYDDLMGQPHISDLTWADDWRVWCASAYPDKSYTGSGPQFSLFSVAVKEAVNGAGVLMAHRSLVEPLMARGALVPAHEHEAEIEMALVLRRNPISGSSPVVDTLVDTMEQLAGRKLLPVDIP